MFQRFGTALVPWGQLHLKQKQFSEDLQPINKDCKCFTCQNHSRAFINSIIGKEPVACHLITMHNIHYQVIEQSFKMKKGSCTLSLLLT